MALSTSALLMIGSLSLQSLVAHERQRSRLALQQTSRSDALLSAAMAFAQAARNSPACLLTLPSEEWSSTPSCPAGVDGPLQSGHVDGLQWRLERWRPGAGAALLELELSDGRRGRVPMLLSSNGAVSVERAH